ADDTRLPARARAIVGRPIGIQQGHLPARLVQVVSRPGAESARPDNDDIAGLAGTHDGPSLAPRCAARPAWSEGGPGNQSLHKFTARDSHKGPSGKCRNAE